MSIQKITLYGKIYLYSGQHILKVHMVKKKKKIRHESPEVDTTRRQWTGCLSAVTGDLIYLQLWTTLREIKI